MKDWLEQRNDRRLDARLHQYTGCPKGGTIGISHLSGSTEPGAERRSVSRGLMMRVVRRMLSRLSIDHPIDGEEKNDRRKGDHLKEFSTHS